MAAVDSNSPISASRPLWPSETCSFLTDPTWFSDQSSHTNLQEITLLSVVNQPYFNEHGFCPGRGINHRHIQDFGHLRNRGDNVRVQRMSSSHPGNKIRLNFIQML